VRTQICRPNPRWKNTLEGAAVNAGEALKTTRVAGVELRLDGDNLVLEASAPPPVAILDLLSGYKPSCDPDLTVGRRRTGRPSLTNAPALRSSLAV